MGTDKRIVRGAQFNVASISGLLGLATAACVHATTFMAETLSPSSPLFWMLHIAIFPLFFGMIFRLRKWSTLSVGALGFRSSALRWREVLAYIPPAAVGFAAVLFAYAMLNFMLAMGHLTAGHGSSVASQMDPEQSRYMVRAFSGHWMIFYALPTIVFLFVPADAVPGDATR